MVEWLQSLCWNDISRQSISDLRGGNHKSSTTKENLMGCWCQQIRQLSRHICNNSERSQVLPHIIMLNSIGEHGNLMLTPYIPRPVTNASWQVHQWFVTHSQYKGEICHPRHSLPNQDHLLRKNHYFITSRWSETCSNLTFPSKN